MEEIDKVMTQFLQASSRNKDRIEVLYPEIRFILLKTWLKKCEALALIDSWYFLTKLKLLSTPHQKLKNFGNN